MRSILIVPGPNHCRKSNHMPPLCLHSMLLIKTNHMPPLCLHSRLLIKTNHMPPLCLHSMLLIKTNHMPPLCLHSMVLIAPRSHVLRPITGSVVLPAGRNTGGYSYKSHSITEPWIMLKHIGITWADRGGGPAPPFWPTM